VAAVGIAISLAGGGSPAIAAPAAPQPGPLYTVNDSADPGDPVCDENACSLRAAITAANADGAASLIVFDLSFPATITLASALPAVSGTLTIDGPGADNLAVSGDHLYRVLEVASGADLTLTNITIRDGHQELAGGGGIYNNRGTLSIRGSSILDSFVNHGGGGIGNNHGALSVSDSLVANNLAGGGDGGGLFNDGGTVSISRTTFSGNDGFHDGGIANHGFIVVRDSYFTGNDARIAGAIDNAIDGAMTIDNSTFSDNTARFNGGAIDNAGVLRVANSTFYNNGSPIGADIANHADAVQVTHSTFYNDSPLPSITSITGAAILRNTILAARAGIANCSNNGPGPLTADSYNLATDATCDSATVKTLAELGLGPLQDNGGSTLTIALLPGSAAINGADDLVCSAPATAPNFGAGGLDQRGETRPQGAHCDTGGYELEFAETNYLPLVVKNEG